MTVCRSRLHYGFADGRKRMNISPLDIRKHEFKKTLRGYDPDEVAAFLDLVSIELEELVRNNSQLKDRISTIEVQLKKYLEIENTLRETLLSAQRAREETINTAKKHADVIIREAEVKSASIIDEGRRDLVRLRNACTDLKVRKDNYLTKIRSLISTQLEMLDNLDISEEEEAFLDTDPIDSVQTRKKQKDPLKRINDQAGNPGNDTDGADGKDGDAASGQ